MGDNTTATPTATPERVTMRTLDDKLATLRAEQKTEHVKTRAMITVLALPSIGKAVSFVGVVWLGWPPSWPF